MTFKKTGYALIASAQATSRRDAGSLRFATTTSLALMLAFVWALTHRYLGLTADAILYAFQALARLHPALAADIYLKFNSQDRFTVFSPIYADCIAHFGLAEAGVFVFCLCTTVSLVAAWFLAKALCSARTAWFSVTMLILTVGVYGAFGIFRFSEEFVTARSVAEALTVTALACHFHGRRVLGLLIVLVALVFHPLMAFPGLLLQLSLWASLRQALAGAVAGIFTAATLSAIARFHVFSSALLGVMDPAWLAVVRERSQFLFLQLWRAKDWSVNARPFFCIAVSAMAIDDTRIRRLCVSAALVGASGLVVALIASVMGPVVLLLQGQAWRWVWITSLVAIILLPEAAMHLWRDRRCGPLCAILLLAGWTFVPIDGTAASLLVLLLWAVRSRIGQRLERALRVAAVAVGLVIVGWTLAVATNSIYLSFDSRAGSPWLQVARNVLGLKIPALLLVGTFYGIVRRVHAAWLPVISSAALATLLAMALPSTFRAVKYMTWVERSPDYADWKRAIPPTANVYVADGHDAPLFTWYTLDRPNYLSGSQSAGVVFSRRTALEVRRRAHNLRPLMSRDWRFLKWYRVAIEKESRKFVSGKPMTVSLLAAICQDPALGFVVARQNVGFDPIVHRGPGAYRNWNLYDCGRIRAIRGPI